MVFVLIVFLRKRFLTFGFVTDGIKTYSLLCFCDKVCIYRNVQLVIDAEQTYLQAAINQLVLALQYKYNKSQPWVYNTYQCYRKVYQFTLIQSGQLYADK